MTMHIENLLRKTCKEYAADYAQEYWKICLGCAGDKLEVAVKFFDVMNDSFPYYEPDNLANALLWTFSTLERMLWRSIAWPLILKLSLQESEPEGMVRIFLNNEALCMKIRVTRSARRIVDGDWWKRCKSTIAHLFLFRPSPHLGLKWFEQHYDSNKARQMMDECFNLYQGKVVVGTYKKTTW